MTAVCRNYRVICADEILAMRGARLLTKGGPEGRGSEVTAVCRTNQQCEKIEEIGRLLRKNQMGANAGRTRRLQSG